MLHCNRNAFITLQIWKHLSQSLLAEFEKGLFWISDSVQYLARVATIRALIVPKGGTLSLALFPFILDSLQLY